MERLLLEWVAYIFIAAIIMFFLISMVNEEFTSSGQIRNYMTRDVSLLFDAFQSADGDLFVNYDTLKIPLEFEVDNDFIYFNDKETNSVSKYPYNKFSDKKFNKEPILCGILFNYTNNNLLISGGDCIE